MANETLLETKEVLAGYRNDFAKNLRRILREGRNTPYGPYHKLPWNTGNLRKSMAVRQVAGGTAQIRGLFYGRILETTEYPNRPHVGWMNDAVEKAVDKTNNQRNVADTILR